MAASCPFSVASLDAVAADAGATFTASYRFGRTLAIGGNYTLSKASGNFDAENVASGPLRALAVASPTRVKDLPDVPTFAEAGFPDAQVVSWYALVAPSKTPAAVRQRLNEEFTKALADPGVRDRLAQAGAMISDRSTPEQVDTMLKQQTVRWEQALKKIKIDKE